MLGSPSRVPAGSALWHPRDVITDVLAIDPGLLSGVAHLHVELDTLVLRSSAELSPVETGYWLLDLLRELPPERTQVVVERFTITAQTARNSQAPWSLEIIGQTRWIMASSGYADRLPALALQDPGSAKIAFPNERLRREGLWHKGGRGHALDAIRHAALFAQTHKIVPSRG